MTEIKIPSLSFLILDVLQRFYARGLSPVKVAEYINAKPSSVRKTLFRLKKQGMVFKEKERYYVIARQPVQAEVYRHYASIIAYCSGQKQQWYAITFKDSNYPIDTEIFNKLLDESIALCGNQRELGYSVTPTTSGMNQSNLYPQIEVGVL